jgi:hypothetical protein
MRGKPRREGHHAPLREQIDRAMALQINKETASGAATPHRAIVHAQDARRGPLCEGEAADVCEQGIAAAADTEMIEESRPRFSTEGKRDRGEPVIEFAGAARDGGDEGRETLGKGAMRAARIDADESADTEVQGDVQAIDGHSTGMSPVGTMDPAGPAVAVGAGGGVAPCSQRQRELPIAGVNLLKVQTGAMGKQGSDTHDADSLCCTMHRESVVSKSARQRGATAEPASHNPRKSRIRGHSMIWAIVPRRCPDAPYQTPIPDRIQNGSRAAGSQ